MFVKTIINCYKIVILWVLIFTLVSCGRNDSAPPVSEVNDQTQTVTTTTTIDQNLNNNYYFDPVIYSFQGNDSIEESSEDLLVAEQSIIHDSQKINYKISIGHLVTEDSKLLIPNARISYISYSLPAASDVNRPITFVFNGGPGLSSLNILFNSFSPQKITANNSTLNDLNSYFLSDNPETLINKTDIVYLNPVGTGLSAAITPFENKDFWGVDSDAKVIAKFIQRYLIKFNKLKSPIYLMGDSYGSVRCIVTAEMLMQDSLFINGLILMSSVFNYSKWQNSEGVIPTLAANAWFHKKIPTAQDADLNSIVARITNIIDHSYSPFMRVWSENYKNFNELLFHNKDIETNNLINEYLKNYSSYYEITSALAKGNLYQVELSKILQYLLSNLNPMPLELANSIAKYTALDANVLRSQTQLTYKQEPFSDLVNYAMLSLLPDEGSALSIYDGREKDTFTRISIADKFNLDRDPKLQNFQKTNSAIWNKYTNINLNYYAASVFQNYNPIISDYWDYKHKNLSGIISEGIDNLNIANDLYEIMKQNTGLKIFQAGGLFDAVTPFYQTYLDLEKISKDTHCQKRVTIKNYVSGHFIYLDSPSRLLLRNDLEKFY